MKKILLERLCSQEFIKFNHPFLMAGRTKVPNDETELIRVVGEEVNWNKKNGGDPGYQPDNTVAEAKKSRLEFLKAYARYLGFISTFAPMTAIPAGYRGRQPGRPKGPGDPGPSLGAMKRPPHPVRTGEPCPDEKDSPGAMGLFLLPVGGQLLLKLFDLLRHLGLIRI